MRTIDSVGWKRRGVSLIWDGAAISTVAKPQEIVSMRQFFSLSRKWPEMLPSSDGDALVVAGLEAILDLPQDVETWLCKSLRPVLHSFEDEYQQQAALIFWLPNAPKRRVLHAPTRRYFWKRATGQQGPDIELGRCIFGGAEFGLIHIVLPGTSPADSDGDAWLGLHHPRMS